MTAMTESVRSAEQQATNYVAGRAQKLQQPTSWTRDSPIQLVPPKMLDTTDQVSCHNAEITSACASQFGMKPHFACDFSILNCTQTLPLRGKERGFDPAGFAEERGLRRRLFYNSPFLTCAACNTVTFIDAACLRTALSLQGSSLDPVLLAAASEALPPCAGCGATVSLRVGASDYIRQIAADRAARARAAQLRATAILILQQAYRQHLARRCGRALRTRMLTLQLLHNRCARAVQAAARGRLGRRAAVTRRHLRTLRGAHPVVVKWAISQCPERRTLFWYPNKAEEALLHEDYLALVERTGFRPSRGTVEANIAELAVRVAERYALYTPY
jgi:hypothetical protein